MKGEADVEFQVLRLEISDCGFRGHGFCGVQLFDLRV